MQGTPVTLVLTNARGELLELLPRVIDRSLNQQEVTYVCALYRRAGIADLLIKGVGDGFASALSKSARAFLYYLGGKAEAEKRTSLSEPFLDAVACGDDEAAAAIAKASRPTWNEGEEYEDDFLYYRLLMLLSAGAGADSPAPLAERYRAVVDGAEDPRLDVCEALVGGDQKMFDQTFGRLVKQKSAAISEKVRDGRLGPDALSTDAKISVDLLALARLAESRGLAAQNEYPLAPLPARRARLKRRPDPESWRNTRAD